MPLEKNQLINANFTDYTGGINVSVAPQLLAENEYQQIKNFEYDYSRLRTRAGISPALSAYPMDIKAVYWDKVTNTCLVCLVDGSVYEENLNGNQNLVGILSGEKGVSFCKFDSKVFIASGGKLQYYDPMDHTITTIESSYLCNIVFERFGRLVITISGDDNLYYSAVGDPYDKKYVEVTVVDENGRSYTTTEEYKEGDADSSETEISGNAEGVTTSTYTAVAKYIGGEANVKDGKEPSENMQGETTSSTKVAKRVDTYDGETLVSSLFFLDDEQQQKEIETSDIRFDKLTFGENPSTSAFVPVTDTNDLYYGAVYQDIKNTDNTVTRTYYLWKKYVVGSGHTVEVLYKIEQIRQAAYVQAGLIPIPQKVIKEVHLSIQKLVITLGDVSEEGEVNLEEVIIKGTDAASNIKLGSKDVGGYSIVDDILAGTVDDSKIAVGTNQTSSCTVLKITGTTAGATSAIYYRTQKLTKTKMSLSSTAATGVFKDHLGRGYGDVLEGGESTNNSLKHTIIKVENEDGSVAEYDYGCDTGGVIKSFAKTLTEVVVDNETSKDCDWTKTMTTLVTKATDDGKKTAITTTSTVLTDANTYTKQFSLFELGFGVSVVISPPAVKKNTVTKKVVSTSGWDDDTNRDDSAKYIEIGYKDDGDIIKVLPMSGDILVFKSNGNVYSVSGEYPNWSQNLIAAGLDYISDNAIAPVNTQVCYLTKKGLNTLQATQTYGNFTTNLAVGNKFNGLIVKKLNFPAMYNIARKHQLLIQPDVNDKGYMICFQYDIGAAITFQFPLPITCVVDTEDGVIFAAGNSLYRWDKQYTNDLGYMSIEQEIVTRKFESSRRLYTRQVDVGIEGTPAGLVEFYWADKRLEYFIKHKRRLLNVFSVCRDGIFTIKTKENIWIDYIKFYLFEK